MKSLIDQNLSPELTALLAAAGHDAVHVRERSMQRATDEAVLETAAAEGRVLVSGDTDFGMLLARSGATEPSFVLFRQRGERRAAQQARLLLENLDELQVELGPGASWCHRRSRPGSTPPTPTEVAAGRARSEASGSAFSASVLSGLGADRARPSGS